MCAQEKEKSGGGHSLAFEVGDQPTDIRALSADYTASAGSDAPFDGAYPTLTHVRVQVVRLAPRSICTRDFFERTILVQQQIDTCGGAPAVQRGRLHADPFSGCGAVVVVHLG